MVKFCIPCVLSLLVSALYNIVDQIFVGNSELSTLGNAATGVVFPIFIIAQGFAWYFGDGSAAYINIHQGRGDTDKIHKCAGTGMTLTLILSVILLAIGYNMGAGNFGRVKKLYRAILMSTVAVGAIATIFFEAAPDAVMSIFGKPTNIPNPDDYWEFGRKIFRIFLALVIFTCTIKMSSIFFQAVGKPVSAVLTSLIRDIICFIPLICILPIFFGIDGILFSAPTADLPAMIVAAGLTVAFFAKMNRNVGK